MNKIGVKKDEVSPEESESENKEDVNRKLMEEIAIEAVN
jgi:hypothetical protein